MGSTIFQQDTDFYILGLWLADGYWSSSSVGLSSINPFLLDKFRKFFNRVSPDHPIKERLYKPKLGEKRKHTAVHLYINSRVLTREFIKWKQNIPLPIPSNFIPAYLAGRIDGDGHVDRKYRTGIRIAYSSKEDASRDLGMFNKLGENPASLYHYKAANTWVLYLRKKFLSQITPSLQKYCWKLLPRRD